MCRWFIYQLCKKQLTMRDRIAIIVPEENILKVTDTSTERKVVIYEKDENHLHHWSFQRE